MKKSFISCILIICLSSRPILENPSPKDLKIKEAIEHAFDEEQKIQTERSEILKQIHQRLFCEKSALEIQYICKYLKTTLRSDESNKFILDTVDAITKNYNSKLYFLYRIWNSRTMVKRQSNDLIAVIAQALYQDNDEQENFYTDTLYKTARTNSSSRIIDSVTQINHPGKPYVKRNAIYPLSTKKSRYET